MTLCLEGFPALGQLLDLAGNICIAAALLWLASLPFQFIWKRIKSLDDSIWYLQADVHAEDCKLEKRIKDLEARIHENQ